MTWFHGLQLVLAMSGVVIAVRQLRARPGRSDDVQALARGVYLLRGLGRMALPLAFLGVIVDLGRGLEATALSYGRASATSLALGRSLVGLCIGAGTAIGCLGVATSLRRRVVARERRHAARALDRAEGGV